MSDIGLIPCSPEGAVQRMLELEASRKGAYSWGAGHFDPDHPGLLGMTVADGIQGWDCAGAAISHAFMLTRHRPGFNERPRASVSGDLNVDSVIEDATPDLGGVQELGELVTAPEPGVLLLTPTIRTPSKGFVEPGHVRMIIDASKWIAAAPRWADVVYLECRGPNGRAPGVVRNTGESVDQWDATWPTHKAVMVRIRARP